MTSIGARPDVTLKISQLQNLCKRDPEGYREDYDAQIRRLRSECGILALSPSADPSPRLVELIQFAAAVSSSSYRGNESDAIADLLIALLLGQSSSMADDVTTEQQGMKGMTSVSMVVPTSALSLHRDVRKACVSALILMRNKGAVPPLRLLELFFRIMATVPDKALREHLYRHIVNDVRNINKKGKQNEAVNRSVQTFLHRVIVSSNSNESSNEELATDVAAKRAVDMVTELYRRNVWTDQRTVAILASAVQSANTSVMSKAIRFFLGIEEKMAEDKVRQESDVWAGANTIDFHRFSTKTKKKSRQIMKQVKNRTKQQAKRELQDKIEREDQGVEASKKLYPAIELLNDPQGLAEAVFRKIRATGSNSYKFETKLLMVNFTTRLVGNHELMILQLYPFLQKYMGGQQRDVTALLAYTVQACHQYVPPDEIYGLLKTIAHNFITERCSGEQMAVGINAVRAICARVPSVLSIEDTSGGTVTMDIEAFSRDLAAYSKHRDRSVGIAGKSWTNFVREVNPSLLQGKDRGKTGVALHRAGEKPLRYGEQRVAVGVAGADLLVEYEAKKAAYLKQKQQRRDRGEDSNDEEESENDVEEVAMNDEEGWVDVEHDEPSNNDDEFEEEEEMESDNEEWEDDDEESEELEEDEEAPELVVVKEVEGKDVAVDLNDDTVIDLAIMTSEERRRLQQDVSSTRVFTVNDFEKMRKLVDREEKAKRDPRAAARKKRRLAQGKDFEELSDDDDDSDGNSADEAIHITGAVDPTDIMANSKKKRLSKIEKLEKIVAGRHTFEHKKREGGSTNTEKKRRKNFVMSKFSTEARQKQNSKGTKRQVKKRRHLNHDREAKKRRRKV